MGPAQSTARLLSAAATVNATLVQSGPSILHGLDGFNAAVITYLKLYDKATAPNETDTPRRTIHLPASARFQLDWADGLQFGRGIGYRLTTDAADNSTLAVALGAILALNVDYR